MTRQKVAVIGAGISGLSAAYLLQAKHEVHLFEAEPRLGGHADTATAGPEKTPVDTGFIVYNELCYPHLTGFFKHFAVPVADTEMTLSVKFNRPDLEWGGGTLRTLFAQKRNLLRPAFWSMVRDILKFNRQAEANLKLAREKDLSLGDLVAQGGYGRPFLDWYLLPMGAAIWSTPTATMLEFPAETFLQFCLNHRLLQVEGRPMWKTVRGGSVEYVKRVAAKLKHVHAGKPVTRVTRVEQGIKVVVGDASHNFDAVVFATHPPETLKILGDPLIEERSVLEAFSYQKNLARLHGDESFLPARRSLWSAWNVHQTADTRSDAPVSLSYWMNCLQPLATARNWIVSLNSEETPQHIEKEIVYEHPLFNRAALKAQSRVKEIQGRGGIYFAGAWTRYGFHEDGILSAVNVAAAFGIQPDWETDTQTHKHEVN